MPAKSKVVVTAVGKAKAPHIPFGGPYAINAHFMPGLGFIIM